MIIFIGEYNVRIDAKGRLVLPSAFKKQIQTSQSEVCDSFILKEDMYEKCLVLYPKSEWNQLNQFIRDNRNPFDREHNQFSRYFSKGAIELSLDSINRLLIPKRLLDFAQINKEVVLCGQDGKIELWAPEVYQHLADNAPNFGDLAKKIMNT